MTRAVRRCLVLALVAGCTVTAAPPPHRSALPPLPDSISTQLGWIRVERVRYPTCGIPSRDSTETLGCFAPRSRRVQIATDLELSQAHETLQHEIVHANLWDAHVALPDSVEEQIADVIGAARVSEMLAHRR